MNTAKGDAAERRAPLPESIVLHLAEGWALGFDNSQWIILRARNLRIQGHWKPVGYVGSEKRILRRVLREIGVQPKAEAAAYLDAMPETFRDWLRRQNELSTRGAA